MPIYMDRHDVFETVTAENVAQLHQEDLKIQDECGCKGLTYWFDDKRKTAFCLIEAPDAESVKKMHAKAHGQIPNRIIEVDASIVESFLGRIEDPEKAQDTALNIINDPAFRTIMIISIDQLSLIISQTVAFKASLQRYYSDVKDLLSTYEGNVVKQADQQLLISFKSVSKAVNAATAIREIFKTFRNEVSNPNMTLKIGLSAGVPVTEKKSIFEDTIKLAERMCKIVDGEIIISAEVKALYDSENATKPAKKENMLVLTPADEKFLTLLMNYTEASWTNTGLQVDDFSKPVGCSKSQLYRKLTSLTGKSPNAFIKDYRLDEALALLGKNKSNISEIAFETGFSSPSYFSKCFQKRYGYQPSDLLSARIN